MDTTRTILVVAPYFPPHMGGLERYAYETARRTNNSDGVRVVVLTTSETNKTWIEKRDSMTVHRLGVACKVSNTPVSLRWFSEVRRLMREMQPDLVHVHTPVPGLGDIAALFAPRRAPLLVTYHAGSMRKGARLPDILIWLYEHTMMRILLRRASHIACSSDAVRTGFLRAYMHKSSTITPAVDAQIFTPGGNQARAHRLLAVGGLESGEEHKGLAQLIAMLPGLRERYPDLVLEVVGDGNLRSRFEGQVNDAGLQGAVTFTGKLSMEKMAAAYRRADIFVLPTTNDSFPTVILEAMASALPVISTTVGSIAHMVTDGTTGYLAAPDDMRAFALRVEQLVCAPALQEAFGRAARERAVEQFSWGRAAAEYRALYERLRDAMPRIVHVVSYFPPHVGGMEIVAERLARGQAELGCRVEVLTSRSGADGAPRIERAASLTIRRLSGFEFAHTPVMWMLLPRLLTLPRNTLVHLHLAQVFTPELALLAAKIRGFRIIAHFHLDVEPSGPLGWLFVLYKKHVLPRVLRAMDAVLVASDAQAAFVAARYAVPRERIHRIVNGVDDLFFQPRKRAAPHTPLRILALSRLTVQKRVDRIIEALPLLSFPAVLFIVGDGEDREKLEHCARTCAPGSVTFVGHRTHREILKYHRWADVFVIPSDREGGMPLTVLEAMAAGLPVVGSNAPGVRDLVAGVGAVVDDPCPKTFAATLCELYGHPERFAVLSEQSAAYARQHTWARVHATVAEAYRALGVSLPSRARALQHT